MEFCEVCDNMLYLEPTPEGLQHKCKKCGSQKSIDGSVVSSVVFVKPEQAIPINKYTKFDPTLPRAPTVPCPTKGCPNATLPSEVIYYRYNHAELKYIYLCPKCDVLWKPTKN
jgi:DNA-directed RNA polymerase subunit M/transcription elongation factor TFIIS